MTAVTIITLPDKRGYTHPMSNPFLARAIELALANVHLRRGGPFGAVVVKDGEIIAEGANCVTSANDPTAHAEIVAIRLACAKLGNFELRGCELYSSCEPCAMCLGAIYWAHAARVCFGSSAADASRVGFDDTFIYSEIVQPHAKRKIPMIQMMSDEALEPFRAWVLQVNKLLY
jgi:guanine deaminase